LSRQAAQLSFIRGSTAFSRIIGVLQALEEVEVTHSVA
jgi:hypothetical protein